MNEYRVIPGFSKYQAASNGDVISYRLKIPMRPYRNKKGYLILGVRADECSKTKCVPVHRLIWMAFHGAIPEGLFVDHIDNNPANNHISNLQLLTNRENVVKGKSQKPKLSQYTGVQKYRQTKTKGARYSARIKHNKHHIWLGTFGSELEASAAYNHALQKILNG